MFELFKRLLRGHVVLAGVVPLFALLLFAFTLYSVFNRPKPIIYTPKINAPSTPFPQKISGLGVVEAASQNLEIATPIAGVVLKMDKQVGQKVTAGDVICTIDDHDTLARLDNIKASLEMAKIDAQERKEQAKRYARVKDKSAISEEIRSKIKYASKTAEAKVKMLEADLKKLRVELERLHIKAPISGEVLYIYKHPGEFADPNHPVLILGDTETLHVRVEFDETEALNVTPRAKAIGLLRGYTSNSIPLRFVRKEAMLKPKKQLLGDGMERFDTRVQEVIYTFTQKSKTAVVGQQIQVYVERVNS